MARDCPNAPPGGGGGRGPCYKASLLTRCWWLQVPENSSTWGVVEIQNCCKLMFSLHLSCKLCMLMGSFCCGLMQCGEEGHIARDCPNPEAAGAGPGGR